MEDTRQKLDRLEKAEDSELNRRMDETKADAAAATALSNDTDDDAEYTKLTLIAQRANALHKALPILRQVEKHQEITEAEINILSASPKQARALLRTMERHKAEYDAITAPLDLASLNEVIRNETIPEKYRALAIYSAGYKCLRQQFGTTRDFEIFQQLADDLLTSDQPALRDMAAYVLEHFEMIMRLAERKFAQLPTPHGLH